MPFIQSSALKSVRYDATARTLTATFRVSGRTYVYEDVPQEVYDALIFSDSMGTYFNTHIRDHFRSRET